MAQAALRSSDVRLYPVAVSALGPGLARPAARVATVHLTIPANGRGRFTIHGLLTGTRVQFLEFSAEPLNRRAATLRAEFCDRALRY